MEARYSQWIMTGTSHHSFMLIPSVLLTIFNIIMPILLCRVSDTLMSDE
jgi:hypothetical protein